MPSFRNAPAHKAISRSGAATVSEISALGIPAVYVPYAVGNGEQRLNAAAAVRAGAALLIDDADLTPERVRSEVVPLLRDDDRIWVHDYHLMLLPAMLREEIGTSKKNVKIGFFLHTPFPTNEIYRILPVRNEILLGVLHSDLIGFHTYDYARHFLSSCSRVLYGHPMI